MSVIVVNEGALILATQFVKTPGAITLNPTIRLYTNNLTPAITNVLADFTALALTGFQEFVFDTGWTWTPGTPSAGKASNVGTFRTMTLSPNAGGVTIYGYVIFDSVSGKAIWAELLGTSIPVPAGGMVLALIPTLTAGLAA